ncbi:MAG: cyclic nucleotide-binding domain-containing protein [Chloroflexota bacterium]
MRQGRVRTYPPNTPLCVEGATDKVFYIILEGAVVVTKRVGEGENLFLKQLGSGDFFGEMALVLDGPRTATVVTQQPTTVLEIAKESFHEVFLDAPDISLVVMREMGRRIRENDEMDIEDLRLQSSEMAVAFQQLTQQDIFRRKRLTEIVEKLRNPVIAIAKKFSSDEMIEKDVEQVISLINDVLFLNGLTIIRFEPATVNISIVLTSAVELVKRKFDEKRLHVRVNPSPALPVINCDVYGIRRTFTALLNWAMRSSPEDGVVDIYAEPLEDDLVLISIADHGLGISREGLPYIFDWHPQEGGYGEGGLQALRWELSLARHIVEAHHGRIEVESVPGEGTTFFVYLPTGWKMRGQNVVQVKKD